MLMVRVGQCLNETREWVLNSGITLNSSQLSKLKKYIPYMPLPSNL